MKKTFLFLLSFSILVACNKDQPKINPTKMQAILTDVQYAEAYSMQTQKDSALRGNKKNIDSLSAFYAVIFNHHHISSEDYFQSLEWYKKHPTDLDSIYLKMIPEFTKQEDIYR